MALVVCYATSVWAQTIPRPLLTAFYIGGHGGYSRGHGNSTLFDPGPRGSSNSFGSLYGGMQIGYNYQLPSRLVLGAEADISFPYFFQDGVVSTRATAQSTVTDRIDDIGTVRGRFGYALDQSLIYGTVGFAWSQARFVETSGLTNNEDKLARTRNGWVLGMGAEVAVTPDWTARLEYLYDRFGGVAAVFPSGTRYTSAFDIHRLRLGLTRQFHGTHVDAASIRMGDPPTAESNNWNIHGQFTFIEQGYPAFRSPYEGSQSLSGASQAKNTVSANAFLGLRLWDGAELYFNPEIDQGFGLNTTHGVSAFPNGEAQKAAFPMPRFVVDRLFLHQTFGLGGQQETIEDGPNQLAGKRDISRITVVVGRLSVADYFNGNVYANDPRTNFLNWNIYGAGAYDWTMDQITWTWGALAELNEKDWAFRIGYFLLPVVSSNNSYDTHIPARGQYTTELERRYSLGSRPGTLRLFGWVNHGTMGGYSDALALPLTTRNYPDITLTRQVRTNPGVVISAEQAITDKFGLFSRASWSPGLVEILGGTDCSESLSLGSVLRGASWGQPNDNVGVSGVIGGLSPAARAYFTAGGLGILIGDGRLNYRAEGVLEAYYAHSLNRWATLSLDYQFVANPGYNADRGPVSIFSGRLHAAF